MKRDETLKENRRGTENVMEMIRTKENKKAQLSNDERFTVFSFGTRIIRFLAPYSLEKYVSVKEWDNGYLVVMAKYKHNEEPEEEYIDLLPILDKLYIDPDEFLSKIETVEVKNA